MWSKLIPYISSHFQFSLWNFKCLSCGPITLSQVLRIFINRDICIKAGFILKKRVNIWLTDGVLLTLNLKKTGAHFQLN